MRIKTISLDETTRAILMRSTINGNRLQLPNEQLARPDYERVAKAIEAAGGKWNKKERCHIFPNDVRETLDIKENSVSVTNVQQTYQSFYTPVEIADQAADMAELSAGCSVLEPSAGSGRLVMAAKSRGIFTSDITAVEIDPRMAERLKDIAGKVVCGDFLTQNGNLGEFDCVLMNPPFSRGDDIKHINHALKFLRSGGLLVAICMNGPKQIEKLQPMAKRWVELREGVFKESGTPIGTAILVIEK